MPLRTQVPPVLPLMLSLAKLSASLCIPGRKKEERQGTKWLLVGFCTLFVKGGPLDDFLLHLVSKNGVIWPRLTSVVTGTFSRIFSSLSGGGRQGIWEWLLSGLTSNTTQKTLLTSHLHTYPNYQLQGCDLYYSFGIILWFFLLGTILLHGWFYLSLRVPVNAFSMESNSLTTPINTGLSSYPFM